MKECLINSVRVSLIDQERVVVLKDKEDERYLPIWIGVYEFEAITLALQKIEVARPLTHDLLKTLMSVLNGRLICIEITALESETYYANLVVEQAGAQIRIDCRPSDGIALVVRTGVPIFVSDAVLDQASIRPEEGIEADEASGEDESNQNGDLRVFEDFLENLDTKTSEQDDAAADKDKPETDGDDDSDQDGDEDQNDTEGLPF